MSRKGGAHRKAPKGLTRVIFVRADTALIDHLEKLRLSRMAKTGYQVTLSTADVVRAILWEAKP